MRHLLRTSALTAGTDASNRLERLTVRTAVGHSRPGRGHRYIPPCRLCPRKRKCCVKKTLKASCCTRDEGGPFGAVLQGKASNRHELLRLNTAVVNVMVKRRGIDRVRYE